MVPVVDHADVIGFVGQQQLMGRGLGWIDMHLLAAASAAGASRSRDEVARARPTSGITLPGGLEPKLSPAAREH